MISLNSAGTLPFERLHQPYISFLKDSDIYMSKDFPKFSSTFYTRSESQLTVNNPLRSTALNLISSCLLKNHPEWMEETLTNHVGIIS